MTVILYEKKSLTKGNNPSCQGESSQEHAWERLSPTESRKPSTENSIP